MRRFVRILGTFMIAGGLCLLAWSFLVWRWQDPFTALYTAYQQHRLSSRYDTQLAAYRTPPRAPRTTAVPVADVRRRVAREAREYRRSLGPGDPIGRLKVPRIGVNAIVVEGTDSHTLTKGPGRYSGSFLPGEGQLIYIAGHRTTYGAPFAHIERLRPGDTVTIEVPYGTFVYRIRDSVVVPGGDVDRLRSRGREEIALQACHPRFFATQRYIAYARPVRVIPRTGPAYSLGAARVAASSSR